MGNNYALTESAEPQLTHFMCLDTLWQNCVAFFHLWNKELGKNSWNNYFTDCMTICPDNGTKNARKMPEFKKTKSVGFITW